MAAVTAKGMCSSRLPLLKLTFLSSVAMANDNEKSNTPDAAQELQDLKATVAKLQAENASLRTSKSTQDNANQFVKNLTAGITQGISQAISTQIKPSGSKNKLAKQPDAVELNPDLPECFNDM